MNISKTQQRTLHALAQGGRIDLVRENDRIVGVECLSREGWLLTDCTLAVFKSLKKRRLIASSGGGPYRITRDGLANLRAQLNNRVTPRTW
ncbi:MAG TPA: YjhX family toxin [Caulobacter sp.]|nr:YjhX family toxin [Caulobacter sp.]